MSKLEIFLSDPYDFIINASIDDLIEIAKQADIAYYNNDEPIISDNEYDLIVDRIKEIDPTNPYLSKPAHTQIQLTDTITDKEKAVLPYSMGSMDKHKPGDEHQIEKYKKEFPAPWILSDKLDGVSALYILNHDSESELYTRGTGKIGTVVTNLIPLINIAKPKVKRRIAIRGELIMSKRNFEKYADKMANARNMVAGIVNAKTINKNRAKDIDFVAYEMIDPWDTYINQYKELTRLKFNVVYHILVDTLNNLTDILRDRRENSPYECDGIIVAHNAPRQRSLSDTPEYAFAFKDNAGLAFGYVIVKEVEWNVSKDRYLKPTLKFDPIKLSGVKIKSITGFNAKYILENCIGPGAKLKIVRSGDVIPYILNVEEPSTSRTPDLPPLDTYEWNETEVDIIAIEESEQHRVKELVFFCTNMKIKNLSEGNIKKMIDVGIDTIPKLLSVTKKKLESVEGFKEKMASKIYEEIKSKLETASLLDFMVGSNCFGRGIGSKKIKKILEEIPDIIYQYIEQNDHVLINKIVEIDGFDTITATRFINGMQKFLNLLKDIPDVMQNRIILDVFTEEEQLGNELEGAKVVFSGFRNKDWEKIVESLGGQVTTVVSKKTTLLVTRKADIEANKNDKLLKAKEYGVKIMSQEEFEKHYIK